MTDSNAKLIQLQELAKAAAEQVAAQQGKSEPVPHEIVELVTTCQALLPELTKALQDYQNQVKNLQADVTSAEEKATDYEVEILAAHQDRDQALDKLEKHTATQNAIEAFVNARPEYVTALKNTRGDDPQSDYWRWQGHAEARRQLAHSLGWTIPHHVGEKTTKK